jgi:hypothetical protein
MGTAMSAGKVLTPIVDNVWGAERPFMWNRIDVGGRSAVIRLSDGKCFASLPMCTAAASAGVQIGQHVGDMHVCSKDHWAITRVAQKYAGTLWTQSPVELTPDLRQACDDVGEVKHIVSPNFEHTSFGKQVGCARAYACRFHSSLVVTLAICLYMITLGPGILQWKDAYPSATLYGCPGLSEKETEKGCAAFCIAV